MQRLVWALRDRQAYDLEKITAEYFESVKDWNIKLRTMRNKARLLVGEDRARDFLDYADDEQPDKPHSLHYIFVKVGRAAIAAKTNPEMMDKAEQQAAQLNWICSTFLEDLTTEFLQKAYKLQILEIPTPVRTKRETNAEPIRDPA